MGWELLLTSLLSLYFVLHDAISLVLCPFSEDWKIWILLCVDCTLFSSLVIFCLLPSVSPNVDPLNEEMADELNQIPLFDFLVINNAFVKGDRITLSDFEHKRIQTKAGVHLPISGPLTGPSVEKLEMISPRSLQL